MKECILLNAATMFWPLWYTSLLPEDWWCHTEPYWNCPNVRSWVVTNDPLSEGIPGGAIRAPQTPGQTLVLPTRTDDLLGNDSIGHFAAPLPRKRDEEGNWEQGEAWETVPASGSQEGEAAPEVVLGAGDAAAKARSGSAAAKEEQPIEIDPESIDQEAEMWLGGRH